MNNLTMLQKINTTSEIILRLDGATNAIDFQRHSKTGFMFVLDINYKIEFKFERTKHIFWFLLKRQNNV